VCVSEVVTIRQRAESFSVRVGADHFLVGHHPGGGVIHLRGGRRSRRSETLGQTQHRKTTEVQHGLKCSEIDRKATVCVCVCVCVRECARALVFFNASAVLCWFYALVHLLR